MNWVILATPPFIRTPPHPTPSRLQTADCDSVAHDAPIAAALSPTDGLSDCTTYGASVLPAECEPHSDADATPVATAEPSPDGAADDATYAAANRSPYSNTQRSTITDGKLCRRSCAALYPTHPPAHPPTLDSFHHLLPPPPSASPHNTSTIADHDVCADASPSVRAHASPVTVAVGAAVAVAKRAADGAADGATDRLTVARAHTAAKPYPNGPADRAADRAADGTADDPPDGPPDDLTNNPTDGAAFVSAYVDSIRPAIAVAVASTDDALALGRAIAGALARPILPADADPVVCVVCAFSPTHRRSVVWANGHAEPSANADAESGPVICVVCAFSPTHRRSVVWANGHAERHEGTKFSPDGEPDRH